MEWYRKKSWSITDEKDFFERLGGARKSSRPQYLKIQAIELLTTDQPRLLDVAESLLLKYLKEFPDESFHRSSVLHALGDIENRRQNSLKALNYFDLALSAEREFPQVKTQAYLDYSEIVIKTKNVDLFGRVKELLMDRMDGLLFPIEKYKIFSILSVMSQHDGDAAKSKEFAEFADQNATAETSGLRYHKHLGLVEERDSWLDRLVKSPRK